MKFYERGRRPLEIVTSRQWYIRNGGRDQDRREAFLARGKELAWFPDHMRHRYEHWVEGLNGDWLVSRQRFFGVPIPLWYRLDSDGEPDYAEPIVPAEDTLPIDPSADVPPGFTEDQRGQPGGFIGDPDVMDTWATSSLTPQIAAHWVDDPELFARLFPMDIRPQGPEIIRTWLFSTVVRSHYEHGSLPWSSATLNGWILDPDRKKMSKSKGNVVTPLHLFDQYGTDAVRYWAISARPGVDTAVSEEQMKVGRRLAIKLLNVTKFVLGIAGDEPADGAITDPVDLRDGGAAGRRRRRGDDGVRGFRLRQGARADRGVLLVVLRRLRRARQGPGLRQPRRRTPPRRHAPRCATRSARCSGCSPRPSRSPPRRRGAGGTTAACTPSRGRSPANVGGARRTEGHLDLEVVSEILGRVRRAKTEAKLSQRAPVSRLVVHTPSRHAVEPAREDLVDALTVTELEVRRGPRRWRGRLRDHGWLKRPAGRLSPVAAAVPRTPDHRRTWPERFAIGASIAAARDLLRHRRGPRRRLHGPAAA